MASFVGDGIVTKISFKKSYDLWGNREYLPKDDILKILSKRINMSLYDVIDTADGFILLLNPRLVNEHLHDLLKEIAHINFLSVNWLKRKCYLHFNSLDILNSEFKINLNEKFEYELYGNDILIEKEQEIISDCYNMVYFPNEAIGYTVNVSLICLGRQYDEILSEDNTLALYLMNKNLKRFESPISSTFVYGFIDN